MTKGKGIRVYGYHGASRDVVAEVRTVCKGFARLSEVRHGITVTVAPAFVLGDPNGVRCFGAFAEPPYSPKRYKNRLDIYVVGRISKRICRAGRREAVREVGIITLHELVHYEKWRDGLPQKERGITNRAKSLRKKISKTSAEVKL